MHTTQGISARQFDETGFAVIEGLFDETELARLRTAADEQVRGFDPQPGHSIFTTTDSDRGRDEYFLRSAEAVHCFLEEQAVDDQGRLQVPADQAINKLGHALHDHLPAFRAFCRDRRIKILLDELGMVDPLLWQTMYIFKQPRIGGVVRWHQDASYLRTQPSSVLGVWLALEDATRDNGCLWMAPGGHHSPLREQYVVDWQTRLGELQRLDDSPWPGPDQAVAVEVPAGSVVLFHDHMPHYSSPNRSDRSRQAFTMHFAPAAARWLPDNWLQRPSLGPFRV